MEAACRRSRGIPAVSPPNARGKPAGFYDGSPFKPAGFIQISHGDPAGFPRDARGLPAGFYLLIDMGVFDDADSEFQNNFSWKCVLNEEFTRITKISHFFQWNPMNFIF